VHSLCKQHAIPISAVFRGFSPRKAGFPALARTTLVRAALIWSAGSPATTQLKDEG